MKRMVKKASKESMHSGQKRKLYILDTNVFLHDPEAMMHFDNAFIGIPINVLEELENFKKEGTERGRNSRTTIRMLDKLRSHGSLGQGVQLSNGATVKILFEQETNTKYMPLTIPLVDNKILATAVAYQREGYDVCFISKDLNARVKADALGIPTEDYVTEHIMPEEFYRGWIVVEVPAVELKDEEPRILSSIAQQHKLFANQFVLLQSNNNPHNTRLFRYLPSGRFKHIHDHSLNWPLYARNHQQRMALDLLFDESISFVTLLGPAGTGKTFLALLSGLYQVIAEDVYEKMLVSRPVVPLGRDIGYLPGDVSEKLRSWMLPIYDNIEFIQHSINAGRYIQLPEGEQDWNERKKNKKKAHKKAAKKQQSFPSLDELLYHHKISLEAITYMRGRSIPYQYILIDEGQNLTPHEIKTIVSRAGQGSKIIVVGDPYQIDSTYLDFSSNGLVTASEAFKGQDVFGTVFLNISERSTLSKLASELL